ncbi:uncharacterized protein LOC111115787 [Crassostrea virginica]
MDLNHPFTSQDLLRCNLCDTPMPPLYCQLCDINLCKTCAGDHLVDETKEHRVVPIKQKWNPRNPLCPKHTTKHCDFHCKQCDKPICASCVLSEEHDQHKKIDIFERKIENLEDELNKLQHSIYPKYENSASDIKIKKDNVKKNSEKMKTIIIEHGQLWHREIDNIIKNFLSKINENETEQLNIFENEERKININMNEILKDIKDLKNLVNSKDANLVSEYITRLPEFSQFPPELKVSLPNFTSYSVDTKLFGNLSNCYSDEELYNYIYCLPVSKPVKFIPSHEAKGGAMVGGKKAPPPPPPKLEN